MTTQTEAWASGRSGMGRDSYWRRGFRDGVGLRKMGIRWGDSYERHEFHLEMSVTWIVWV